MVHVNSTEQNSSLEVNCHSVHFFAIFGTRSFITIHLTSRMSPLRQCRPPDRLVMQYIPRKLQILYIHYRVGKSLTLGSINVITVYYTEHFV